MTASVPLLFTAHIDGASRGNPGHAGFGIVISVDGVGEVYRRAGYLGKTTNNQAEYHALLYSLQALRDLGLTRGIIHSDSELLVKQISGEYRVKDDTLRPMFQEAVAAIERLDEVLVRHVRREQNSEADALANIGIDWGLLDSGEKAG